MSNKGYKGILVFAQQQNGIIHRVSYELLNKARQLAEKKQVPVYCVVLGPDNMNLQELIMRGADTVYYLNNEAFNEPDELVYKENLVALIQDVKPEIVLIGATRFGRSLAPRIAAALRTGLTADCTDLEIDEEGRLVQIRPAFSENILAHIKTETYPQMATIRYKEFEEGKPDPERKGLIVEKESLAKKNNFLEVLEMVGKQEINISEAEVVVAGGRGVKNSEDFRLLKELAEELGGLVGASRAVVDDGLISKDHQVGYSGNRVKPKIYIACGISGAPQHLAGMKESEVIIAINTDPSAPIFKVADYGIVGDLYEIIPELLEEIRREKGVQ